MKNKIVYLIFVFIINFSFIQSADCRLFISDINYSEDNLETLSFNSKLDAYRYVSLGVGPVIFIPNIGIGYRERYSKFGWDTALSFSSIGYAHQLSTHFVGHYYLNPSKKNSPYLGFGLLISGVITNDKDSFFTVSPNFVVGKELNISGNRRHFIEMHVGVPSLSCGRHLGHPMYVPLTYVKYGMAF